MCWEHNVASHMQLMGRFRMCSVMLCVVGPCRGKTNRLGRPCPLACTRWGHWQVKDQGFLCHDMLELHRSQLFPPGSKQERAAMSAFPDPFPDVSLTENTREVCPSWLFPDPPGATKGGEQAGRMQEKADIVVSFLHFSSFFVAFFFVFFTFSDASSSLAPR